MWPGIGDLDLFIPPVSVLKSQFVSPNRKISFPSASKKPRTCSCLSKVSNGSLGGLYHESIMKGLARDGVIYAQSISIFDLGISSVISNLKVSRQKNCNPSAMAISVESPKFVPFNYEEVI